MSRSDKMTSVRLGRELEKITDSIPVRTYCAKEKCKVSLRHAGDDEDRRILFTLNDRGFRVFDDADGLIQYCFEKLGVQP